MAKSLVLDMYYTIQGANLGKVKREMGGLATNFGNNVTKALIQATKGAGLKVSPQLEKLKAEGLRINKLLGAARTKNEKESILAQEKSFKKDYYNLRVMTERRLKAQKRLKEDLDEGWSKSTEEFGRDLSGVMRDAMSLDIGSSMKGLGKITAKIGLMLQAKQTSGALGKLVGWLGRGVQGLGHFAMAAGGVTLALAAIGAGIMKVLDHGAKMNRAVTDSGAVFGDLAASGANVRDTFQELRDATSDLGHNLEWMQTGEEQMKILGAFSQAGYTVKEMGKDLKTAEERAKKYRAAIETATTYSKLLGMSTDEVAENLSSYMNELGTSLEGVRDRFAQVYEVAQQSGFGTKRFFGMVLQATSGMAMYNVRLEDTAGLLMHLGKMLGQRAAQAKLGEMTEGFKNEKATDLYKRQMKMGEPRAAKLVGSEAQRTSRDLLKKFGEQNVDTKKLQDIMGEKGIAFDTSSAEAMSVSIGKAVKGGQQVALTQALKKAGVSDELVTQMVGSFSTMKAAYTKNPKDVAQAMANVSPQGKMIAELYAVAGVIKKPIEEMTFEEVAGFQEMEGVSQGEFEQRKALSIQTKANFGELQDLMKQNNELNAKDPKTQKAERKKMIEKFGAYINKQGKMVIANDPKVLDYDEDQLEEYEKSNTIANDLFTYQTSIGAAHQQNVEKEMDQQTQLAIDIAQNTEDFSKVMEIGTEKILTEIYGVLMDILRWFTKGDPEEDRKRKEAQDAIEEQKGVFKDELRKQMRELSKAKKELEKLPKGSEKRAEKEKEIKALEMAVAGLETESEQLTGASKVMRDFAGPAFIEKLGNELTGLVGVDTVDRKTAKGYEAMAKRVAGNKMAGGGPLATLEKKLGGTEEGAEKIAALKASSMRDAMKERELARQQAEDAGEQFKEWSPRKLEQKAMHFYREQLGALLGAGGVGAAGVRGEAGNISGKVARQQEREAEENSAMSIKAGLGSSKAATQAAAIVATMPQFKDDKAKKAIEDLTKALEGKGPLPPYLAKVLQDSTKTAELVGRGMSAGTASKLGILPEAEDTNMNALSKDEQNILTEVAKQGKAQLEEYIKARQAEEVNLPKEQQRYTNLFLKEQPEKWADAWEKRMAKRDRQELAGALGELGAEDASGFASALMGGGVLKEAQKAWLREHKADLSGKLSGGAYEAVGKQTSLDDFIWRPGSPPARISDKDVLMGGKAGGPLAKGSRGGGGGAVINHFYNDSKGFLANQSKMKRAMTGYA